MGAQMLRLSERAVRKILIDQRLYSAGHYAGKRDIYLQEARQRKRLGELTGDEAQGQITSLLMRNARINHRIYWQLLKRIPLAQVIPFRVPTLQAG